jgi:hypothetical protein
MLVESEIMENSEFGKGFVYCIGLFLCHAERDKKFFGKDYSLWFNSAADHLFELIIPENISDEFKLKIKNWQNKCLEFRLNEASKEDFLSAIKTAKEILFEYDLFLGNCAVVGDWE